MVGLNNMVQGAPARLFPVVADTSKENRIASVFLSLLPQLPNLSKKLFQTLSIRLGARSNIQCFTEVMLQNDADKASRPDGLIVIKTGSKTWSALVEFKIGKADLNKDQVERYLQLAKDNKINAVITISNQFVARANHPPLAVSKSLLKKVDLFHWSWMSIFTASRLLQIEKTEPTEAQQFLLDEFARFLEHKSTGIAGFNQMNKGWREVVAAAKTGKILAKTSPEVEATVAGWLEEQRDICLLFSRIVGKPVRQKIETKLASDPVKRLANEINKFCDQKALTAVLQVPEAASDIWLEANLERRIVSLKMKLKAASDRKSTKARINWLLRMLPTDDERIFVRAHWPSRTGYTQSSLTELRADPACIQSHNRTLSPHRFEILLIEPLGTRFAGPRSFIEDVERLVPEFYALVGQHLKKWQPKAPKPVESAKEVEEKPKFLSLTNPIQT